MLDLSEKLRTIQQSDSEEERRRLWQQLQAHLREDDVRRKLRNVRLMNSVERLGERAASLRQLTDRLRLIKRQYDVLASHLVDDAVDSQSQLGGTGAPPPTVQSELSAGQVRLLQFRAGQSLAAGDAEWMSHPRLADTHEPRGAVGGRWTAAADSWAPWQLRPDDYRWQQLGAEQLGRSSVLRSRIATCLTRREVNGSGATWGREPAGGAADRAGPGAYQAGPGPYQAGPGPYQAGPGPYQAGPGPYQAGPGPYQAGPGPDQAGPGPYQAGPGPDQVGPGPYQAGPGPYQAGPGPDQAGPGQDEAGPGLDQAGPGPYQAGPGPYQAGPGPYQAGPGPYQADRRSDAARAGPSAVGAGTSEDQVAAGGVDCSVAMQDRSLSEYSLSAPGGRRRSAATTTATNTASAAAAAAWNGTLQGVASRWGTLDRPEDDWRDAGPANHLQGALRQGRLLSHTRDPSEHDRPPADDNYEGRSSSWFGRESRPRAVHPEDLTKHQRTQSSYQEFHDDEQERGYRQSHLTRQTKRSQYQDQELGQDSFGTGCPTAASRHNQELQQQHQQGHRDSWQQGPESTRQESGSYRDNRLRCRESERRQPEPGYARQERDYRRHESGLGNPGSGSSPGETRRRDSLSEHQEVESGYRELAARQESDASRLAPAPSGRHTPEESASSSPDRLSPTCADTRRVDNQGGLSTVEPAVGPAGGPRPGVAPTPLSRPASQVIQQSPAKQASRRKKKSDWLGGSDVSPPELDRPGATGTGGRTVAPPDGAAAARQDVRGLTDNNGGVKPGPDPSGQERPPPLRLRLDSGSDSYHLSADHGGDDDTGDDDDDFWG